ncbi:hypothetical protein ACWEIJ_35445 [Lentzea sp. NPDC004789]
MTERMKRSLKDLIWPLMRLLVWALAIIALLVALHLGHDPVVAMAVVGGAATIAYPIARWVQNATPAQAPADPAGQAEIS